MLRNLKLLVSLLAIGNVAGLVGLVVWLAASDRINAERLQDVREVFAATIVEEQREADRLAAEEAARQEQLKELGRPGTTPIHADAVMDVINDRDEAARERYEREETSIRYLREDLENRRTALRLEQERFATMVENFEARRRALAEREGSEQFAKAVKIYSLTKPDEARDMMLNLIRDGQTDQVVSYLNAMKPDISQRIVSAFIETDPNLAADLLERLRTHGLELPDDDATALVEP